MRKRERKKSGRDRDRNTKVPGMLNTLEDLQRRQGELSIQNGKENTQFSLMEHYGGICRLRARIKPVASHILPGELNKPCVHCANPAHPCKQVQL